MSVRMQGSLTRPILEDLLCVVVLYHAVSRQRWPYTPRPDLEALKHALEVAIRDSRQSDQTVQ